MGGAACRFGCDLHEKRRPSRAKLGFCLLGYLAWVPPPTKEGPAICHPREGAEMGGKSWRVISTPLARPSPFWAGWWLLKGRMEKWNFSKTMKMVSLGSSS